MVNHRFELTFTYSMLQCINLTVFEIALEGLTGKWGKYVSNLYAKLS